VKEERLDGVITAVDGCERDGWVLALFVMAVISSAAFLVQRFVLPLFNAAFEICVFYVPTIVLLVIYLRRTLGRKAA
jgi:hypothetical protein